MQSHKLDFANDSIRIIHNLCRLAFNVSSSDAVQKVFGISEDQLESIVKKIIDALPEQIFNRNPQILQEIKNIFAREFIFFQVQERWDDPRYADDLLNFIHVFSRDIQARFDIYKNYKSKIKEDD